MSRKYCAWPSSTPKTSASKPNATRDPPAQRAIWEPRASKVFLGLEVDPEFTAPLAPLVRQASEGAKARKERGARKETSENQEGWETPGRKGRMARSASRGWKATEGPLALEVMSAPREAKDQLAVKVWHGAYPAMSEYSEAYIACLFLGVNPFTPKIKKLRSPNLLKRNV